MCIIENTEGELTSTPHCHNYTTDTRQHHLCMGSTTWEGLGRLSHSGLLWALFLLEAKALGTAG